MGNLLLNGQTAFTQTGTAAPVLASTVNLGSATFPAGHVLQVYYWRIPATQKSTPGSWAWNSTPNSVSTYQVADISFPRISTSSKIVGFASGHVDSTGSSSASTVVSITNGNSPGNIVFGAAYWHVRVQNQEPLPFNFAFEDDCAGQTDPANPQYSLRCHSAATSLYFSRMQAGSTPNNPYTVIFYEVKL